VRAVNAKRGREEAEETLRLVRDSGGNGVVVLADVATREGCRNVINTAVERFGGWTYWLTTPGLGSTLFSSPPMIDL
jgi:3-oxoacyl-[acyl-carrier protein] reductase